MRNVPPGLRGDVRVPLNEAIQMANKLDANGVPCWLFIGEKEGHVFKQTSVQEQHAIAMVHFLDTFLTTTARAAKE
ncbi:hypothetical protein BC831DRAFT_483272 [Entophlyctis helioformis]|nr:hypothetical protein BC831DRAFT_483272 [Entophlyctis helioformis]